MSPSGALEGIRVIDVGLLVQGPQAALTLSDMGADVIKVELPVVGDNARWIPVSMDDPRAPYFEACNRGKRSITLDLRTDGGREAFLRLAETADVIVSNFRPGTLHRWGLGYEAVVGRNPRIIYATGSTFGLAGPSADLEGADLSAQAAEYTYALMTGDNPGRANLGHPLLVGAYGILPTSDGYIALVGVLPDRREAFYRLLGLDDVIDEPQFVGPLLTRPARLALFALMAEKTKARTTSEWADEFAAIGVRRAPVNDYRSAMADPDVVANGYLTEVPHPAGGTAVVVGSPIVMSDTPIAVRGGAPELGQNTEEILLEIGYDWDGIAALRSQNVI